MKSQSNYLEAVFGTGGILASRFQNYERREGQVILSKAVDDALCNRWHLIAEAPTGVGKSLAYLIPAIQRTIESSSKAVIVTANIALQEQLIEKDLPMLASLASTLPNPISFSYGLAKGRSNYLCKDRLASMDQAELSLEKRIESQAIIDWAAETLTGDVSELPFTPSAGVWTEFSVDGESCKGKRCQYYDVCFSTIKARQLQQADLIVSNYHLLFSDMKVREATDDSVCVLPSYAFAILDEGHRAADIARGFFGKTFSEWSVRRLVMDAIRTFRESKRQLGTFQDLFLELEDTSEKWLDMLSAYRKSRSYNIRLRRYYEIDPSKVCGALENVASQLIDLSENDSLESIHRESFRRLGSKAREFSNHLEAARDLPDQNMVYFLEDRGKRVAVSCKPIDPSETLRTWLFDRVQSAVVVSATLTVDGKFGHVAKELGVSRFAELSVESPFDIESQTLLICPDTIPEPNDSSFRESVAEHVVNAVKQAKGRTLALFTSYQNLEIARDYLERANLGYRILCQGQAPRTQLIEEFRRDIHSVLLGTDSFWEGVDVPGEALSCVVMDRLPFQPPDDPVLDAISAQNPRGWFSSWYIPRAIIAFRQGFGRGVRTQTDRCVIVLLDRRVVSKPYGKRFLRSLGSIRISRSFDDIGGFLE